jgi:hypothetical protein
MANLILMHRLRDKSFKPNKRGMEIKTIVAFSYQRVKVEYDRWVM